MATYIIENVVTIEHEEIQDSPQEQLDPNGNLTATRVLQCAWSDRFELARQIGGYNEIHDNGDVSYHKSQKYPHSDESIYATSVTINPYGGMVASSDATLAHYNLARLQVEYGSSSWQQENEGSGSKIFEESITPDAQFLTLNNRKLYWGTGSSKEPIEENDAPAVLLQGAEYSYRTTMANLPAGFLGKYGHVNDTSLNVPTLGISFEAETAMLADFAPTREITAEGNTEWDVRVTLKIKPSGWNKFPKPNSTASDGLVFEEIYDGEGNQVKPYQPDDLSDFV